MVRGQSTENSPCAEKGAEARLKAGEALRENTKSAFQQLKGFLSATDLQYQMIADKLGLEILQCGIDYFNDSEESEAAHKAMSLQKYAQSIVVGQMAKDRCKENVDILQKIIDELPPTEVYAEDKAIKEELEEFDLYVSEIEYAVTLLKKTKPHLRIIKAKLGATNRYYLKISTLIVGKALHNLIEEVNTSHEQTASEERKILRKAWKATLIMDAFDMNKDFKDNCYDSNRSVLKKMCESNDVYSHPYIAASVLMAISVIIGCIDPHNAGIGFIIGLMSFIYPFIERYGQGAEDLVRRVSGGGCIGILLIIVLFVHYWIYRGLRYCIKY